MAKSAGDVRCSKWSNDIYSIDGVRRDYGELPKGRQDLIKEKKKEVIKEMWSNLKDKSVQLQTDQGMITVQFNKAGVEHVANDLMLTLSGKYFSEKFMVNIDQVLAKSEYVPTDHTSRHGGSRANELYFRFEDKTGRGVWFKVKYVPNAGDKKHFTLYSVVDKPE